MCVRSVLVVVSWRVFLCFSLWVCLAVLCVVRWV